MKIFNIILSISVVSASLFAEINSANKEITVTKNSIIKTNNVIDLQKDNELLENPEVIRLLNNAYKKGFIDGSDESKLVMINKLNKMDKYMNQLFAFHKLYLEGKLQPPKIGIVSEPVQVTKEGRVMVIQQEYLEIIEPAKFVNKPKTWKNFIW